MPVLPKITPFVKFIRNYPRVLYFPHQVGYWWRHYSLFYGYSRTNSQFVNIIKLKLHNCMKMWIIFFRVQKHICNSLAVHVGKILFLPLENIIQIFAPPCYILYVYMTTTANNNNTLSKQPRLRKIGDTSHMFVQANACNFPISPL